MGGASSKFNDTDWSKADGELKSSFDTVDGSSPTISYTMATLHKLALSQRSYHVTDEYSNLLYSTKAVPATVACFDILGRGMDEKVARVTVDLTRKNWTVYSFGEPAFDGQLEDMEESARAGTKLYRKAKIKVTWDRYHAVVMKYGPPVEDGDDDCLDEADDDNSDLASSIATVEEITEEEQDSKQQISIENDENHDNNTDEVSNSVVVSPEPKHASEENGEDIVPNGATNSEGEEKREGCGEKVKVTATVKKNLPFLSISEGRFIGRGLVVQKIKAASVRMGQRCDELRTKIREESKTKELALGYMNDLRKSYHSASTNLAKYAGTGSDDVSIDLFLSSFSQSNGNLAPPYRKEGKSDPAGRLLTDSPILKVEEINHIFGQHQTMLFSDSEKNSIDEAKTNEEEPKQNEPLVSYWSWNNSYTIHKMKLHVAKNSDLALHVALAVITNQLRYERNAIALTI